MASRTTINLLVNYSVEPKKQGSSGGAWDWGGREPVEAGEEPAGAVELGDADEEGEQAGWGEAGGCDGENPIEAFDRAQGDDLGGGRGEVFGAPGENIDVGQCKGADDFAKKGDLLLPGLHERNARRREADLDGQAGSRRRSRCQEGRQKSLGSWRRRCRLVPGRQEAPGPGRRWKWRQASWQRGTGAGRGTGIRRSGG